jgi:hypothetical protein
MSKSAILNIPLEQINYNRKSKRITLKILDFTYIGHYERKDTIKNLIDDILELLKERNLEKNKIFFINGATNEKISKKLQIKELEETKNRIEQLKNIQPVREKDIEDTLQPRVKEAVSKSRKAKKKEESLSELVMDELLGGMREDSQEFEEEDFEKSKRYRDLPKPSAPAGTSRLSSIEEKKLEEPIIEYDINLGLQYYSVMKMKMNYLFYVYFSYDVLEILDEEGKTVYKTKFKIKTRKKEPPILDLKIEGEGFEVHPLSGKVLVKKDSINPPVMVFSITPKKTKKKLLKKKEEQRNYLHIFINYEGEEVNHTVLSIIVQPKQFQIKLGPLRLNVSKTTAMVLSFLSVLIATLSAVYSVLSIQDSLNTSSSSLQILSDIAPGFGGLLLMTVYFVLIFKKSIYPLKEKWSDFINFDKGIPIIK